MGPEIGQLILDVGLVLLKFLGATSLLGLIVMVAAYYAFPPNLSLEEIKDKGKINFESRLVVKNIGKLPAFNVVVDVAKMNFVMGGLNVTNIATTDCGVPTEKLASGEIMEIPVCPHVAVPPGSNLQSCDYDLILKYDLRLLFFKKLLKKRWHVELRMTDTDFTWQTSMR